MPGVELRHGDGAMHGDLFGIMEGIGGSIEYQFKSWSR